MDILAEMAQSSRRWIHFPKMQAFQMPHLSDYHLPALVRVRAGIGMLRSRTPAGLSQNSETVGLSHDQHWLFVPADVNRKKERVGVHSICCCKNAMG
jgi:hypothetical protein